MFTNLFKLLESNNGGPIIFAASIVSIILAIIVALTVKEIYAPPLSPQEYCLKKQFDEVNPNVEICLQFTNDLHVYTSTVN